MGDLLIVVGILAVLVLIVGFWVMSVYNGLVRTRNAKDNNYSQIGIQLTRKYDLIPNLVKLAKGYMKHERATLEEVIQARNQAANANAAVSANPSDPAAMKNMVAAENSLGGVMGRLFALTESYPDLKANQNFLALQEELTSTENKIAFSRQSYNDAVLFFNNKIQMFPSNIIANTFNFNAEEFFEIEDAAEKEVPKVSFADKQGG